MMELDRNSKEYLEKIEKNEDLEYLNPFIVRCEYCKRTPEVKVKGCTAELIKVSCSCQADKQITNEEYIKKMKTGDFRMNICKGENCPFKGKAIGHIFCKDDGEWYCIDCFEDSHKDHQIIDGNINCDDHPNEEGISFCKQCSKVFCSICKDNHADHAGLVNLKVKKCEVKKTCGKNAYKYCCNCERWFCNKCITTREQEHKLEFLPEILQDCECRSGEKIKFYCKKCKTHICNDTEDCKGLHRNHNTQDLKELEDTTFDENKKLIENFEEKIKQVDQQIHFNRTKYLLYKGHLLKKIKELEDLFIKNDYINKNIYTLMNSLLTTYKNERSFFMLFSIKEMSKFNIKLEEQFDEQKRFEEIDKSIEKFQNFLKYEFALSSDIPNYFYNLKDYGLIKKTDLGQSYNLIQIDQENLASCGKGNSDRRFGKVFITNAVADEKEFKTPEERIFKHNDKKQVEINYICTRVKKENTIANNPQEIPEKYNDIISCGGDKLIRIWSWKQKKYKFEKAKEFKKNNHEHSINKIIVLNTIAGEPDRFASCSDDTKIKIWTLYKEYKDFPLMNITTNQQVKSIIQIKNKNILISASIPIQTSSRQTLSGEVRIWDISESSINNTETVEKGIADCKCKLDITCGYPNSLMQITGPVKDTIICGSVDGNVYILEEKEDFIYEKIYSISNKNFIDTTSNHEITKGGVSCFIQLQDHSILCGCPNGNFVQICDVGKKEKKEESGFQFISSCKTKPLDSDVVDFKNIEVDEKIYFYALSLNGQLIQYKI